MIDLPGVPEVVDWVNPKSEWNRYVRSLGRDLDWMLTHRDNVLIAGVYAIVCQYDGRWYIGASDNVERRWRQHRALLRRDAHANKWLQNAWGTYGEESFFFQLLEQYSFDSGFPRDVAAELRKREREIIAECPAERLYNEIPEKYLDSQP